MHNDSLFQNKCALSQYTCSFLIGHKKALTNYDKWTKYSSHMKSDTFQAHERVNDRYRQQIPDLKGIIYFGTSPHQGVVYLGFFIFRITLIFEMHVSTAFVPSVHDPNTLEMF